MEKRLVSEPEVVRRVKCHMLSEGLGGKTIESVLVHAHSSLTSLKDLEPFHTISIGGSFPDLLARTSENEVVAIEAKGVTSLEKGLGQAMTYLPNVHFSYLAAPCQSILQRHKEAATRAGIGLLGVDGHIVRVELLPEDCRPPLRVARALIDKMNDIWTTHEGARTFTLNEPIHYIVPPVVMAEQNLERASRRDLEERMVKLWPYIQQSTSYAIRGAQSLGLVNSFGSDVRITENGRVVGRSFSIDELRRIKDSKPSSSLYFERSDKLSLVLRMALLGLSQTQLILQALRALASENKTPANLLDLYIRARSIKPELADALFLDPRKQRQLQDSEGNLDLTRLSKRHLRGTTPYQFKRMLCHAGFVRGVARSGKFYSPESDWWELV